jgi:hypothetical protein
MFNFVFERKAILTLIFISHLTFEVTPASPAHIHSHQLNKERVEDGSYTSRDQAHIVDGQHRTEFDHEAILGNYCISSNISLLAFVSFIACVLCPGNIVNVI